MNYGEFLQKIKTYCINRSIKNELLVNEPIEIIISTAKIKKTKGGSRGELLYYEVSEASRIINNKLELSPKIKDALRYKGMEEKTIDAFEGFYEDNIDKNLIGDMIDDFLNIIEEDPVFKKTEITQIKACSSDPALFLGKILIKSLKEPNIKNNIENAVVWSNGDNYIQIIEGDIFKYIFGRRIKKKRIAVIPVNTSFDVHVSTQLEAESLPQVSQATLHGDFLLRLYKSDYNENEIAKRIRQNLILNNLLEDPSKVISMSIGTVVSLDVENAIVYLLAISKFDRNNNARSSKQDIKKAINKLLEYYDKKGQGYELYLPLMGTGMSRAYLNNQDSLDLILDTILKKKDKLQGKINIVILPEAMKKMNFKKEAK